jgi:hypothetical protein
MGSIGMRNEYILVFLRKYGFRRVVFLFEGEYR